MLMFLLLFASECQDPSTLSMRDCDAAERKTGKRSLHQLRKKGHLGPRHRVNPRPARQNKKANGRVTVSFFVIQGVTGSTPFLDLGNERSY